MRSFSERYGHAQEKEIQADSMDDDLKRRISDVIYERLGTIPTRPVWTRWVKRGVAELEHPVPSSSYWTRGMTTMSGWSVHSRNVLMQKIEETKAHNEIYDLIQLIVQSMEDPEGPMYAGIGSPRKKFVSDMNAVLEEERSGWRIENDMIVPAVARADLEAIREAASISAENARLSNDAMRAMGPSDPNFETSIMLSAKMVENTLDGIGARGNGVGSKLDSVSKGLALPDCIVKSFKRMNAFANEFARHPHDQDTYRDDRNDAMVILVWSSAMSRYLHGRWVDRGRPAP